MWHTGKDTMSFCDILPSDVQVESNKETTDKSMLRDNLQSNWPEILQKVKVMKDEEVFHAERDQRSSGKLINIHMDMYIYI